ncbi:MAG: type IV pilus assembly protein PilM [Deltaproteobacteria bacterium]|nr:type IV pilus assembly protein PilM [Deltaproteobacteria bacterium]
MPQKVIGLDIGLRSIKAVQLTSTLRGYELTNFARCEVPYSEEGDGLKERTLAVESLLKENGFSGDTIVSSLPGNLSMIHYLELPFSDPKKVRQVVKFELEPYLPMPIDEVVVDSQVMENPIAENAQILTAAAKKTTIKEHLLQMKGAGFDPRIVDVESFASYNCLVHFRPDDLDGVILFLDIGMDHTGLTIIVNGLPKSFRAIPFGGDTITSALAAALGLEGGEAEELKRNTPLPLKQPSEKASSTLAKALDPLIQEIQITLCSMQSQLRNYGPFQIILTGGGSRLQNIEEFLGEVLGMPARRFEPPAGSLPGLEKIDQGEQQHIAAGIGLALRGINRGVVQVNMRQEEFSVLHRLQEIRGKFVFLGIALAFILALGAADILVSLHIKESRYQALKKEVRHTFKQTFPDITTIVAELPQSRTRIKEEKNRVSLLGGSRQEGSMLDILEAIHFAIPKQLQVRITDLNVDEKLVFIAGETESFDVVDKIKTSLLASPLIREVKIESAKMSSTTGVVEFKFKAQRK